MKPIYAFVWNFIEDLYRMTGINLAAPILFVWPGFSAWLFGKMIGVKGVEVDK
jgi:hypothetical protein